MGIMREWGRNESSRQRGLREDGLVVYEKVKSFDHPDFSRP